VTVAWALAIASSLLGADLRVDGGVRLDGRSRTVDVAGAQRNTAVEVAARPSASLTVVAPDVQIAGRYAPVLQASDVLLSARTDVLHFADVRGRLRLDPTWMLGTVVSGERGTTDLLTEARLRGAAPETLPTTGALAFSSLRADLALDGRIDPRTAVAFSAGWGARGGDDAASRALLPFEHTIRGSARADWNATRLDVLSLQATALGTRLADGREGGFAMFLAGWRHRIDREIEARAAAGAAAARDDAPAQPRRAELVPAGEIGVAHASERHHLADEALVRLGSSLDRVTGTVDRTVELEASARWLPDPPLTLAFRGVAAFVRHDAGDGRRGSVDVRVDRRLSAYLSMGLGVYAAWQRSSDPALVSFAEVGAVFGIAVDLAQAAAPRP
jgi:hypothetical protein